jgi:hypothetical protein
VPTSKYFSNGTITRVEWGLNPEAAVMFEVRRHQLSGFVTEYFV